jgi:hypothetical protein
MINVYRNTNSSRMFEGIREKGERKRE